MLSSRRCWVSSSRRPPTTSFLVYAAMSSAVEIAEPAVQPGDGFQSVTSVGGSVPAKAAACCWVST